MGHGMTVPFSEAELRYFQDERDEDSGVVMGPMGVIVSDVLMDAFQAYLASGRDVRAIIRRFEKFAYELPEYFKNELLRQRACLVSNLEHPEFTWVPGELATVDLLLTRLGVDPSAEKAER